jgi:hypothetical protein
MGNAPRVTGALPVRYTPKPNEATPAWFENVPQSF